MLHRRLYQFLIIYFAGADIAAGDQIQLKPFRLRHSQPQRNLAYRPRVLSHLYPKAVINTLAVAILGHILSICLATTVGIIGRMKIWVGSFIRVAAYNIQAYPIVAVAPIIFILLGDGLSSRLLIAAMICYFPLLLSFIGIFSEPVS